MDPVPRPARANALTGVVCVDTSKAPVGGARSGSRQHRCLHELATTPESRPPESARLGHDVVPHVAACLLLLGAAQEVAALPAPAHRLLESLREELEGIAVTVSGQVSRAGRRSELVDLVALVEGCARTAERTHPLSIRVAFSAAPRVLGVRGELRRAVENVLDHACRTSPTGRVEVRVSQHDGFAEVKVTDDGPGLGRIPRGTGWGLEQVLAAVHAHGGELAIEPDPSGGTSVRLTLPVARSLAP